MRGMREYQILDEDFDQTRFAQEMRLSSRSAIIIPLVASFLSPLVHKCNQDMLERYTP